MCLDIGLSNYLKAMFKKWAVDDSCLRPGRVLTEERQHGDGVERSWAGGGEGSAVKPCDLLSARYRLSRVCPMLQVPMFIRPVPPVPANRARRQLMPISTFVISCSAFSY